MSLLVGLEEEHGRIQEDGESKAKKDEEEESEDDTPVYSLVTGELHQVRRFGHREDRKGIEGTQDALVVRNKEEGLVKHQGLESVAGKSRRSARPRPLLTVLGMSSQPITSLNASGPVLTSLRDSGATSGSQVRSRRDAGVSPRVIESMG